MLRVIQPCGRKKTLSGWFTDNHEGGFASLRDQLAETEVRDKNRRCTSHLILSTLYRIFLGEIDLFHRKLPHGQNELTAAQFSNRKITVQGQQVHCELACVCALPGNRVVQ